MNKSEIQYEIFEKLSKEKKAARLAGSKDRVSNQVRANLKKMFGDRANEVVPEEDVNAFIEDLFSTDGPATGTGGSSILLGASRLANDRARKAATALPSSPATNQSDGGNVESFSTLGSTLSGTR